MQCKGRQTRPRSVQAHNRKSPCQLLTRTLLGIAMLNLAEAVRFELTNPCGLPVFKTGAIDHSATLPSLEF